MKKLPPELIAKELLALAKANNVEMTEEEAKTYFEQLSASGTVSDDELDAVVGGGFLGLSCPTDDDEESEESSATPLGDSDATPRCSKCGSSEIGYQLYLGDKIYRCQKCKSIVTLGVNKRAL